MTPAATVVLVLLIAPAAALALHLDLERADARRRTRDRLRGPRASLAASVARPKYRPRTLAEQMADLALATEAFKAAIQGTLAPALQAAAATLARAFKAGPK